MQSDVTSGKESSLNLRALLAGRQERLFEALVHFHQLEVVRLEDVLGSAEREVVAPLNGRIRKRKHVQQQGGAQSS